MGVRNNKGILCSERKHISTHYLCMSGKMEEKAFLFPMDGNEAGLRA